MGSFIDKLFTIPFALGIFAVFALMLGILMFLRNIIAELIYAWFKVTHEKTLDFLNAIFYVAVGIFYVTRIFIY